MNSVEGAAGPYPGSVRLRYAPTPELMLRQMRTESEASAEWCARPSDDEWFEWAVFAAILAAALAALSVALDRDVGFPEAVLAVGLFYLFGWLNEVKLRRRLAAKFCASPAAANDIRILLDPDGLRATYEGLELSMSWRAVDSVFQFEKSVMIGASGSFVMIPLEALPADLKVEELIEKVAAWRQGS
ncbi:MAG: hypothetical protein AAF160_08835 [Pseudomonadota bacterium]